MKKDFSLPSSRTIAADALCTFFITYPQEQEGEKGRGKKPKNYQHNNQSQAFSALLDNTINRAGIQHSFSAQDRALTMELAYGVLRRCQQLDCIVSHLSKTPLKKLNPFIHQILRVALYQIFFLDRIPDSAAVNEAVKSCKQGRLAKSLPCQRKNQYGKHLYGFVNAVLRQAVRQKKALKELAETGAGETDGGEITNHPEWLSSCWQRAFGREKSRTVCRINNTPPPLTLRINSLRTSREKFCRLIVEKDCKEYSEESVECGIAPDAVLLKKGGAVSSLPGYREGYFQVQDQSAQLASLLLAPFAGSRKILDACAGVGGKTSHILQLAPESTVYAVEPNAGRLQSLRENMRRLFGSQGILENKEDAADKREGRDAVPRLFLYNADFLDLTPQLFPLFDAILLDVPCSGKGVIRRRPDIRWRRSREDVLRCQKMQKRLLSHSSRFLAAGGVLVYATCSLEREENDEVVAEFLTNHPDFQLENPAPFLPDAAHCLIRDNFFAPLPEENLDGFFAARLVRRKI